MKEVLMKTNSWIIGILGLWIIFSSFISANMQFVIWSNVISGLIVAVAGFTMVKSKPEFGWLAGIFGIWMMLTPFIPAVLVGKGLMWNGIIVGLIAAIDGFTSMINRPPKTAHNL